MFLFQDSRFNVASRSSILLLSFPLLPIPTLSKVHIRYLGENESKMKGTGIREAEMAPTERKKLKEIDAFGEAESND